jgi:hypothetical protein
MTSPARAYCRGIEAETRQNAALCSTASNRDFLFKNNKAPPFSGEALFEIEGVLDGEA